MRLLLLGSALAFGAGSPAPPEPPPPPTGGVGLAGELGPDGFVLEQLAPGSAAHTRLRPGQVVHVIDGRSVHGRDTAEVVAMLEGPVGSMVHLRVEGTGGLRDVWLPRSTAREEAAPWGTIPPWRAHPGPDPRKFGHIRGYLMTTTPTAER